MSVIADKDSWAGHAQSGAAADPRPGTGACTVPDAEPRFVVRRFRLVIVDGPARGVTWRSTTDRCSIGSHQRNDLVVDDPTVSRFHCEIRLDEGGARVRDLSSRNRVVLDGVVVVEAFLRADSLLRLGKTVIRFELDAEMNSLPLSEATRFGSLIGASTAMRALFAMLARAAASDATLVLEGETGTGKSQAAQSIHDSSPRRDRPFLTADCSAMVGNLLESELFGHEKGAFTGATSRRIGVFEEAAGGTVFLDENIDTANALATAATVGLVVGLAGAAAGTVVLVAFGPEGRSPGAAAGRAPLPGAVAWSAGVGLGGFEIQGKF